MKLLLLLSMICFCGCGEMYPKSYVVIEIGGKGEVDSLKMSMDTIIIFRSHFIKNDSLFKTKN